MKQKIRTFLRWIDKNYYRILAAIAVILLAIAAITLWWLANEIIAYLRFYADSGFIRVFNMN